ncbi:MAG: hypothetical protein Q7S75_00425 [bacterium]|nr:hypothetical protein [bacterium]
MKKIVHIIKSLFKREEIKALPKVNRKETISDPVYHFFVHGKANERKRVYAKALKAAEADQKEIIRKYKLLAEKDLISV